MRSIDERLDEDLQKFLETEYADNTLEIRKVMKKSTVTTTNTQLTSGTRINTKDLFSDHMRKKVAKTRPTYWMWIGRVVLCVAMFAIVVYASVAAFDSLYGYVMVPLTLALVLASVIRVLVHDS